MEILCFVLLEAVSSVAGFLSGQSLYRIIEKSEEIMNWKEADL